MESAAALHLTTILAELPVCVLDVQQRLFSTAKRRTRRQDEDTPAWNTLAHTTGEAGFASREANSLLEIFKDSRAAVNCSPRLNWQLHRFDNGHCTDTSGSTNTHGSTNRSIPSGRCELISLFNCVSSHKQLIIAQLRPCLRVCVREKNISHIAQQISAELRK